MEVPGLLYLMRKLRRQAVGRPTGWGLGTTCASWFARWFHPSSRAGHLALSADP